MDNIFPAETMQHHFEVTIADEPIGDFEELWLYQVAVINEVDLTISESKRILLFDKVTSITQLAKILAQMGLAEDIGMIKEITEYYPLYEASDSDQLSLF